MKIWDTAGHERFHSITAGFYKNADAIIIAFDVSKIKSFENVKKWNDSINENSKLNIPRILVGTKFDLEDFREVSFE